MGGAQPPALLFGVDVGGTKIQSLLADPDGTVLAEARTPTPEGGGEAVLTLIAAHLHQLAAGRAVAAAGIGLPGAVDPETGHLDRIPHLHGLEGQPMRDLLSQRLGLPVAVENDVNLAALGESWRGHGAQNRLAARAGLAFVALGTGIGMGLAYGDRLLRGRMGAAGEIAWLPIGADPAAPDARRMGALETVVSGAAVVADYRRRGGTRPGSLRELSRANLPDPVLDQTMEALAGRVALAILSVASVVDPALFVLGGGIGSRPELLERIRPACVRLGMRDPDLRVSHLGNRAGAIGAIRAAGLLAKTARSL